MRRLVVLALLSLTIGACKATPPASRVGPAPRYALTTVMAALTSPRGLAISPDGIDLSTTEGLVLLGPEGQLRTLARAGQILQAPAGLAIATGSTFIADPRGNRVWRMVADAAPEAFAGTGTSLYPIGDGGLAVSAQLNAPSDVAIDAAGNLYIADTANQRIRRVDPDGRITTVAGNGTAAFAGDGGLATEASLNQPTAVAVSPDGTLYVADTGNHAVRRIGRDGRVSTLAGDGRAGFRGDGGPAAKSELRAPRGIAALTNGDVLVADTGNRRIRWIHPGGLIQTVAGNGQSGSSDDASDATTAPLKAPTAIAIAPDGAPFFTDQESGRLYQLREATASPSP